MVCLCVYYNYMGQAHFFVHGLESDILPLCIVCIWRHKWESTGLVSLESNYPYLPQHVWFTL